VPGGLCRPGSALETLATVLAWVFWLAVAVLPLGLLRLGALYLAMRLARTAAADGVYTAHFARIMRIGAGMRADLEGTV